MVSFTAATNALAFTAMILSSASASSNLRASNNERQLQSFCSTYYIPFLCPPQQEQAQCPEVSPLTEAEFDLDQYISKSWYIQKQQVNPYQSEEQLFCVVATYNANAGSEFISVDNYGNNGQVNGPSQVSDDESFFADLCAKQNSGGELAVAPCVFGPTFDFTAGPYWVLAVADDYSWAIVSGGQPDQPYQAADGSTVCTTKEGTSFLDTNGSGLWLFTREQMPPATTIATMESKLESMGVYTGLLKDVAHEGCLYEGATLKL